MINFNLEKNLRIVRELYPDFAKMIEEAPMPDWAEAVVAENGSTNLRVRDSADKTELVYDEKNPANCEGIEKIVVTHNQKATMLFGIGAGHGLKELLRIREPRHTILVVEPILALIRLAMTEYDFSDVLKDGTIFFCPGKAEVEYTLAVLEGNRMIDGWNYLMDRTVNRRAEYWRLMDDSLELLNQTIGNISTVESHGPEMAANDIANLPYLIRHRGVAELKGLFAEKPAIIVATGPSLERNIHMLREVQERGTAIIIAVAQALRPLLSYGVRPDFICTVDFGEVNMTHLDGLMDQDVPMICITKAYKPLIQAYKGPKFVSASGAPGGPASLYTLLNHRGALMQGGSVLHFAFGLGAALGSNPMILVGADLAYPDQQVSHFGQADSMGKLKVVNGMIVWTVEDPRSPKLNKAPIVMGEARWVPGYFGGEVLTNAGLLSFITTMEGYAHMAAASGVTVVDATEGGAHIRGTRRMFLRDALDRYCKEPIDKAPLTPLLTRADDGEILVGDAIRLLAEDIQTLSQAREHAAQGIKFAKNCLKFWDRANLSYAMARNTEHTLKAQELCRKILPMGYTLLKAMRKMESREYVVPKKDLERVFEDVSVRERTVKRNLVILEAVRDSADTLLKVFKESHDLLTRYRAGEACLDPTGETKPPRLDDAETYFEQGNFARPLLEACRNIPMAKMSDHEVALAYPEAVRVVIRANNMRNEKIKKAEELQRADRESGRDRLPVYLDLIQDSQDLGRAGKVEEAAAKIREAIDMFPDREEAVWGLATMLAALQRNEDALFEYEWLRKKDPANLRYDFEVGQVLLRMEGRRAEGIALIQKAIDGDPARFGQYQEELDSIKTESAPQK